MANEYPTKGRFVGISRTIDEKQLGLEEKRLSKEFKERIISNLFSPNFLTFLLIASLIGAGIGLLFSDRTFEHVSEYWKWIVPLITTYIGYSIGKQSDSKGD